MRKFKYNNEEFEMNYPNDIAPVLLAEKTPDKDVDLKELEEKYKGNKIFSYETNNYDENTGKLTPVIYYYIGAKCTTAKEYRLIDEYNYECPPKNMLIEVILQIGNFKRKFYKNIKNSNCSMMDLLDTAMEEIKEELFENDDYITFVLYDDGGWQIDTDIDEDGIEDLVTSVRLVEEVEDERA